MAIRLTEVFIKQTVDFSVSQFHRQVDKNPDNFHQIQKAFDEASAELAQIERLFIDFDRIKKLKDKALDEIKEIFRDLKIAAKTLDQITEE